MPRVADLLIDTLIDAGVRHVFGVPGGAVGALFDALIGRPELAFHTSRHETLAVFEACGCYLGGGGVACVLVTSGPGVTNAITGLASAFADGIPVVVICGEVASKNAGRGALQDGTIHHLDVLAMVRPVSKFVMTTLHAGSAAGVLRRAIATASSGRKGPVMVSVPVDVAGAQVERATVALGPQLAFSVDEGNLERAAQLIGAAQRPVLLLGSGARHPRAREGARWLAEKTGARVLTSPKAKGVFPETHPLALGVFGYGGHPSAVEHLAVPPDVLVVIGSSLGETSTLGWSPQLRPARAMVQIDIDATVIGRSYPTEVALVGYAEDIVPRLVDRTPRRATSLPPSTGSGVRRTPLPPPSGAPGVHPARAVELLQRLLPDDTLYTVDIGEHLLFALHHLVIPERGELIAHLGVGSMGSGIGSAVGAKIARPERPVVALCGDFGAQMYGADVALCVEQRVPLVVVVFNDGQMRMVEVGLERIFGRSLGFGGASIDFAAWARALGAIGVVVEREEELEALDLASRDLPLVVDLRVDRSARYPQPARADSLGTFTRA